MRTSSVASRCLHGGKGMDRLSMRCEEFKFPFIVGIDFIGDDSLDCLLAVMTAVTSAEPVASADADRGCKRG